MYDLIAVGAFVAIALLIILNLAVSRGITRDSTITVPQKCAHVLAVWILPLLGGIFALAFLATHHSRRELKSIVPFPFYLAAPDTRVDYPTSSSASPNDIAEGVCGEE